MTARRRPRYRVIVYELDDTDAIVMDAEGDGFHAAVGTIRQRRLTGNHGAAGPPHLLEHIADLIANNPTGPPPR
jgi:hypothetical protein